MKELKKNPFYYIYTIAAIICSISIIATDNWGEFLSNWNITLVYTILLSTLILLYSKLENPIIYSLSIGFTFAALLSHSAMIASVSLAIPILVYFLVSRRSRFDDLAYLAFSVLKLYAGGFVYYEIFKGTPGLESNPLIEVFYAIAAGVTILLIDFINGTIVTFLRRDRKEAPQKFTEVYKKFLYSFTVQLPLNLQLWAYAIVFAYLVYNQNYVMVVLMIFPAATYYYYYMEKDQTRTTISEAIYLLNDMINMRDEYTFEHSATVAHYSKAIAIKMGYNQDFCEEVYQLGLLHDIGKVGIRDDILLKNKGLSDQQWAAMKSHPVLGAQLLNKFSVLNMSVEGIRHHHERFDGTGYPDRLKGNNIPVAARIIAVCDAWNAMRTDRPYRKAIPFDIAVEEIRKGMGTQFDPYIARIALEVFLPDEPSAGIIRRKGGRLY